MSQPEDPRIPQQPSMDSAQSTRRGDGPARAAQSTKRGDAPANPRPASAGQSTKRGDLPPADGGAPGQSTRRADAGGAGGTRWSAYIPPGEMIAERYTVHDRFPGVTGEADVYRCHDVVEQGAVVVKFYRPGIKPDEKVLGTLLNLKHSNLVTVLDMGWWESRFYEVQEYCVGGTALEAFAKRPPTVAEMQRMTAQVIAGLYYLHESNHTHRDIKPSNIFFRDAERTIAVVGDYGIARSEEGGVTSRNAGTLEYKAPEVAAEQRFSRKTDYYALGISLLALLRGGVPFQDAQGHRLSEEAIIDLKSREKVPLPEDCPPRLQSIILGLTRYSPDVRWGYAQVQQWLKNETVRLDDGRLDTDYVPGRVRRATYLYDREIGSPEELAQKLGQNFEPGNAYFQKVRQELFRGAIAQWLLDSWSSISERVHQIEENYTKHPDLGTFLLRYTLDPRQPLQVQDHALRSYQDFAELLKASVPIPLGWGDGESQGLREAELLLSGPVSTTAAQLAAMLDRGELECWLQATVHGGEVERLLGELAAIRRRLASAPAALRIFAVYAAIWPAAPLVLHPGVQIASLGEIAEVFSGTVPASDARSVGLVSTNGGARDVRFQLQQHAARSLAAMLYDGRLAEWLRYGFAETPLPGDAAAPRSQAERWVRACAGTYQAQGLGVAALRWQVEPTLGIEFAGRECATPAALARTIAESGANYVVAWELCAAGFLRCWLRETGRMPETAPLDAVIGDRALSVNAKIEVLLAKLDPSLGGPVLEVRYRDQRLDRGVVDLGLIPEHASRNLQLQLLNTGRGHLAGTAAETGAGIQLSSKGAFEGAPSLLQVVVRPRGLPVGATHRGSVRINSNGGNRTIQVEFSISAPIGEMARNTAVAACLGLVVLGGLRWGLRAAHPQAATWMAWADWNHLYPPSSNAASYIVFGIPFILLMAGFIYYLISLATRLRK